MCAEASCQSCFERLRSGCLHTIEEQGTRVVVRRNALEKSERVANAVRRSRGKLRRVEKRVDGDDFLKQRGHDAWVWKSKVSMRGCGGKRKSDGQVWGRKFARTERMPQDEGQLGDLLSFFAQL